MKKHYANCTVFVVALMLSRCATFEPGMRYQDLTRPRQPDATSVQQGLEVSVEQFASESKAEMAFDADVASYGILPLLVRVENKGSENFTVLRSDIIASLGGQLLSPIMSNEAAKEAGTREYAGKALGWTVATGPFFIFLWPATIAGSAAHTQSVNKRIVQHFENLAFNDARLKPNQTAAGFVYFKLPDGVEQIKNLSVEVQPSDDKTGKKLSYKLTVRDIPLGIGVAGRGTGTATPTSEAEEQTGDITYLQKEPPLKTLFDGEVVYVDDGTCSKGMVKRVTEGRHTRFDKVLNPRKRECVPKPTGAAGTGTATTSQTPEAAIVPKVEQGSGQPSQKLETAYAITPPDYKVDWSLVKEPVYNEGDWWKVKIERILVSDERSGQNKNSEYLLEIQEGKPKLYAISGANKKELDLPEIEDEILGLGKITRKLKFPLRVGNRWAHRYRREGRVSRERWVTVEYKVLGRQKVQTPKGMFEAFKLRSFFEYSNQNHYYEYTETYYYSPKVKAIILRKFNMRRSGKLRLDRTVTVVDFNVSH